MNRPMTVVSRLKDISRSRTHTQS